MLLLAFLMACSGGDDTGGVVGDATAGEALYTSNCVSCHGADGTGVTAEAADLTFEINDLSDAELTVVINDGKESMPGFSSTLDAQAVADIIAYMHEAFGG